LKRLPLLAGVFAALTVFSAYGEEDARSRDLNLYIAIEASSDSNVNRSDTSPERDGPFLVYGGANYRQTTNEGDSIETGAKARFSRYIENSQYDSNEYEVFLQGTKKAYNGDIGVEVKYADLTDSANQDLAIIDRAKRIAWSGNIKYNAEWSAAELQFNTGLEGLDYKEPAYDAADSDVLKMDVSLKRMTETKSLLSLDYSRRLIDYRDVSRSDVDVNCLGLGYTFPKGQELALDTSIRYTNINPDSGDSEDTVTGFLRATWNIRQEKDRLMFLYARDVLPSIVGTRALNEKGQVVFQHEFNGDMKCEAGFLYEQSEYDYGSPDVRRYTGWGGITVALNSHTLSYIKVKYVDREDTGGMGLSYQETTVTLGLYYEY